MKAVAQASAELEGTKRKQLSLERQLEHLEQQNLQLTYPQTATTNDSLEERRLQAMIIHLQNELAARTSVPPPSEPAKTVVGPGDTLRIAIGGVPGKPANVSDFYQVESIGTVPLGLGIGRVKVAGLSIVEAEEAIKRHLAEKFEDANVQATIEHRAEPVSAGTTPNDLPRNQFVPDRLTVEQLSVIVTKQISALHESLAAIQRENAELKKQVEELRKERASTVK